MQKNHHHRRGWRATTWLAALGTALGGALVTAPAASAEGDEAGRAAEVAEYWTAERIAAAQPREMVIAEDGLAYLRRADGFIVGHGHGNGEARRPVVQASSVGRAAPGGQETRPGPGGNDDTTPPSVTNMDPAEGATIGDSYTFSATVTDASGIKSVTFTVVYPNGNTQNFTPTASGDVYSTTLSGFSNGAWGWYVTAKDNAKKGGNTTVTNTVNFTVDVGGGGGNPPPGGDVVNSRWTFGGAVQTAAGRIYFEMPSTGPFWSGYVCSGTVATDGTSGRSVIITAAHCVYDDANKVFARNVLFIPDQDGTTGSGTDTNCNNDPLGCWAPDHGVVDVDWTTRTFPDNIPWDYAYYVVGDNAHAGSGTAGPLDSIAGDLPVQWTAPSTGVTTHALGYSQSDDPNFMYCKEAMTTEGADNWWLPNCGLSGGSSGGPWIQPMDEGTGSGPIISVNSWGYTSAPGMAGPLLHSTTAQCIFNAALATPIGGVADRGEIVTC